MRRQIEDKYGRWCGFVLLGKDNREIIVLTAYNVPQDTPAGDNTLHAQQTSLYLLDGEVDPNPRKNFIRDLVTLVTEAKEDNQDIILMGDFNEVVGDDPKMMAKVIAAGNLTDVHAHRHGHANIATYIRGRRQLDYCFVSPRILEHVLRCGFEAFHARKVCDHREYFVDLSMIGLFDRRLPAIVNPAERCICSNHPRLVRKYIIKLASYFEDHNIVRKVTEIQHNYSYEAVEKLDKLITTGMKCAKQECRNDARLPWSPEIHEKMTQVNILRLYMSSLQNKIDCIDQIKKKQQSLKVQQPLPPTVKETTELLKVAQTQDRQLWKKYQSKQTTVIEDQEEAYIASWQDMCPI